MLRVFVFGLAVALLIVDPCSAFAGGSSHGLLKRKAGDSLCRARPPLRQPTMKLDGKGDDQGLDGLHEWASKHVRRLASSGLAGIYLSAAMLTGMPSPEPFIPVQVCAAVCDAVTPRCISCPQGTLSFLRILLVDSCAVFLPLFANAHAFVCVRFLREIAFLRPLAAQ